MVGILLSYWGGLFSGATLVSGRVNPHTFGGSMLFFWWCKEKDVSLNYPSRTQTAHSLETNCLVETEPIPYTSNQSIFKYIWSHSQVNRWTEIFLSFSVEFVWKNMAFLRRNNSHTTWTFTHRTRHVPDFFCFSSVCSTCQDIIVFYWKGNLEVPLELNCG